MSYERDGEWFTEVNGIRVIKVDDPDIKHGGPWPNGNPIGYLFHYTAGPGTNLTGVFEDRGCSANFSVDLDGRIYQYVPLSNYSYHAYEASRVYWGVEHSGLPNKWDFTEVELDHSARLTAAIVQYTKDRWGFDIPLVKTKGVELVPGFKDHRDGTASTWNPNVHGDGLFIWSWSKYLERVKYYMEEPMTDEETEMLRGTFQFQKGILTWMENPDPSREVGPDWPELIKKGFRFAKAAYTRPATPGEG